MKLKKQKMGVGVWCGSHTSLKKAQTSNKQGYMNLRGKFKGWEKPSDKKLTAAQYKKIFDKWSVCFTPVSATWD